MRGKSLTYSSLVFFVIALAAWVLTGFLFFDVSARLASREQLFASESTDAAQAKSAIQIETIATDTAAQRASLQQFIGNDVVSIANDIDAAGTAAGAKTTIGSASTANVSGLPSGVTALNFVVQSTGSFSQVWRTAQLLQTLPLPSRVEEFDFTQIPSSDQKANSWELTTNIDVLTNVQVTQ